MTTANTDLIRINKNDIATALASLSLTTADDLHTIVQGNSVMLIKQENVRGLSSESIASLIQIEHKTGADLSGSDLEIVTTSVWNKVLVFKSGMLLPPTKYTTVFAELLATITFTIIIESDEDIMVIGIK